MVEVQRMWRIGGSNNAVAEISLQSGKRGAPQVGVRLLGGTPNGERSFDVEVAEAVAQALLEASEISSALATPVVDMQRTEVRVPS